jgi:hypothetical protein
MVLTRGQLLGQKKQQHYELYLLLPTDLQNHIKEMIPRSRIPKTDRRYKMLKRVVREKLLKARLSKPSTTEETQNPA